MFRNRVVIALLSVLILAGCGLHGAPKTPTAISRLGISEYSAADFDKDYDKYKTLVEGKKLEEAQLLRDRMINRIEIDIERNYREFETKLFYNRGLSNMASDIAELGLATSIGAVGEIAVKDLLAASLTAFKGTRLSIDQNFFREKTTEIIISKMQAYRDRVRNRITDKMIRLPANEYPFEEAWRDLIEHFFAGTLQGGIQALANDAGQDATAAKKETEQLEELRIASPEQATNAIRIRKKFNELFNAVFQAPVDQARAQAALGEAREALVSLTGNDDQTLKPTDVFKQLDAEIKRARREPERHRNLLEAFKLGAQ